MDYRKMRHIVFWTVYLAFEIYAEVLWKMGQEPDFQFLEGLKAVTLAECALLFAIKIPIVYLSFFLIAKARKKSDKTLVVTQMVLVFLGFMMVYRWVAFYIIQPHFYHQKNDIFFETQGFLNAMMDTIFILVVAISFKEYALSQKLINREKALIKEKLEAELNFLKAQINPHFLFNTLNNIYSLARKKSDETPEVVLKLSELLRFVLYEAKRESISIAKEIQFLNDYIELEKIRYDKRLEINFDYDVDNPNALIAPLMLIPFVENAFKHGASEATEKSKIDIQLLLKAEILYFKVGNSFENEANPNSDGIGLKNLRRQLELLYETFDLETKIHEQTFEAKLLLHLNKRL